MKVAICCPAHGDVKKAAVSSLFDLALHDADDLELKLALGSGSMLPEVRNQIVARALDWGADWLFWHDADQACAGTTLLDLLRHDLPIVGCNYLRRMEPHLPVASRAGRAVAKADGLEEVDGLGLGLVLISAKVFRAMARPWFRFGYTTDGVAIGEDSLFFFNAKAAGFKIHVDHTLSRSVDHVAEKRMTMEIGRGGDDVSAVFSPAGNLS